MSEQPFVSGKIDEDAYRKADAHFQLVSLVLPPESLQGLAKEVVRRLAFRMPKQIPAEQMPSDAELDALCLALLSSDELAGERIIFEAQSEGARAETLYLSYVAGAARRLGTMWEEDRVSFLEVTLATGRLYRIIRGLRHVLDIDAIAGPDERHVLFALVPEETHTLGIEIASDVFRRRGWDVDVLIGDSQDEIVQRASEVRYASVTLIANSEGKLANLISLVLSLRISQPLAQIVVAGNIVAQVENVDRLVGADAVLADIETAVTKMGDVIGAG